MNTESKYYRPVFNMNGSVTINIFDAEAWKAMLTEIDTIKDVIDYLKEREKLFRGRPSFILPREEYDFAETDAVQLTNHVERDQFETGEYILVSGSEKDLIAYYINNAFSFPEELKNNSRLFLFIKADGMWDRFVKSKLNLDKKEYERISYFLDRIVKDRLILQPDGDKISKAFYELDRLQRTRFIDHFFRFHQEQREKNPQPIFHKSNISFDDRHFIFIYFNSEKSEINDDLLSGFIEKCLHHRNYLMNYSCNEVIAIAFSQDFNSCAFGYINKETLLSEKEKNEMEEVFKSLGWRMRDNN
jgi:hypothetical protein